MTVARKAVSSYQKMKGKSDKTLDSADTLLRQHPSRKVDCLFSNLHRATFSLDLSPLP